MTRTSNQIETEAYRKGGRIDVNQDQCKYSFWARLSALSDSDAAALVVRPAIQDGLEHASMKATDVLIVGGLSRTSLSCAACTLTDAEVAPVAGLELSAFVLPISEYRLIRSDLAIPKCALLQ